MYKFSTRFFIIILTFIIGIISVAGWFYYQKSQPNQMIIPNARHDALLFNGVSERGGINRVTELSELPKLREARLQKGDIEVRIWRGFGLSPLEGVVLKRIDGQWSGLHITTDNYYEPEKAEVKPLNPPKAGWESFWQQLTDKEILTLPQSTENECDISGIDGISYVVEINQDKIYRYYYYPSENGKKCREARQTNEIGEFIGLEFDSGQEECKRAEWFPCMKVIKARLFLQETTGSDDDEIANLFYSLRGDNMQEINKAKTQLLEISEKSSDDKERVITQLIKGTGKLCESGLKGIGDFDQVRTMANLLAGFQSLKALDVLIDCSDQRLPIGGLSYYNYPTMPAIFEYKMKALPKLKEKLKNGRQEIKCQVANALLQIGGKEAENSLKEALNNENDKTVSDCLSNAINSFKNK